MAGFLPRFLRMDGAPSTQRVETLLPLAAHGAADQERQILRRGAPLSEQEIFYARVAGVKATERIRLLQVDAIPEPAHPMLKAAYAALDRLPETPRGLTFRYGILVRRDAVQDRHLLIHELVHTAQYERLGGIKAFLKKYLLECLTIGYQNAPIEQEANSIAMRICSA